MECACDLCSCDYGDGEPCDTLDDRIVKARKPHTCMECDRTINPGERYEYYKGVSSDGLFIQKTCLGCMRLRGDLCCYPGTLAESVRECFGVDILAGSEI